MDNFEWDNFLKCEEAVEKRRNKKNKLIQLVNEKFDKLTDESIDKLITYLEERK